jgi:ketosteroid isomerase-like protein
MTRSPQELFAHHGRALSAADLDAIVVDYADDAVVITPAGAARGAQGIRAAFVFEGDVLFLEWTADSDLNRVEDGVDTFVFRNGEIWAQTVHYTTRPKS